jgi:hypothetical protein
MLRTTLININNTPSQFQETMEIDIRGLDDKRKTIEITGMTSGDTSILSGYVMTLSAQINHMPDKYSADTYVNLYIRSDNYPSISGLTGITESVISSYSIPQVLAIDSFIAMIKTI